MKINISLYGEHSKRLPFAYKEFKQISTNKFNVINDPLYCDYLFIGYFQDLKKNFDEIYFILSKNKNCKLILLSEEPIWDTLWSEGYQEKYRVLIKDGKRINFYFLNHFTSNIYKFNKFPYFITTNNNFFVRYHNFFNRNSLLLKSDIKKLWNTASIRMAFFNERRIGKKYDCEDPLLGRVGLSNFRSEIALSITGKGVLRVGAGWIKSSLPRQKLPDWHLDKLVALDRQCYIVSALENTCAPFYITEKIFDSFAVLGVPIYYKNPSLSFVDSIVDNSFINLFGLNINDSINIISDFTPSELFLGNYIETQRNLNNLFNDFDLYHSERIELVNSIYTEIISIY